MIYSWFYQWKHYVKNFLYFSCNNLCNNNPCSTYHSTSLYSCFPTTQVNISWESTAVYPKGKVTVTWRSMTYYRLWEWDIVGVFLIKYGHSFVPCFVGYINHSFVLMWYNNHIFRFCIITWQWGNPIASEPTLEGIGKSHIYPAITKHNKVWTYRQISNIGRTNFQNLNVSRLVLQLSLPNLLNTCVKLRMKM